MTIPVYSDIVRSSVTEASHLHQKLQTSQSSRSSSGTLLRVIYYPLILASHLVSSRAMPPTHAKAEPIAVVGIGCRFPGGASTPSKLWDLVSKPRDVLVTIPSSRFNPEGFYHEDGEYGGHSNVRHSYLLTEDHTAWDAGFFNVAAGEAVAIDPQQRLLMECVYEALEAGGHSIQALRGSDTAVYVGLVGEEYSDIHYRELNTLPRVRKPFPSLINVMGVEQICLPYVWPQTSISQLAPPAPLCPTASRTFSTGAARA